MKIYLLSINKSSTDAWEKYFRQFPTSDDIEIVNDDFANFMDTHPDIEAIVSPANAFGLMDGGYDLAITNYFGDGLMKDVQDTIINEWYGEQPVGTSITVPIKNRIIRTQSGATKCALLIHTPTMRTPERITDSRIIYQCMRTTLIEALKQKVESIVIPAFGGQCGKVSSNTVAKMMFLAYKQICYHPNELNWEYARHIESELRITEELIKRLQ